MTMCDQTVIFNLCLLNTIPDKCLTNISLFCLKQLDLIVFGGNVCLSIIEKRKEFVSRQEFNSNNKKYWFLGQ